MPQIGWNRVRWDQDRATRLSAPRKTISISSIRMSSRQINAADVVAETRYGEVFPSLVRHGQRLGLAVSPGKSGAGGLALDPAVGRTGCANARAQAPR